MKRDSHDPKSVLLALLVLFVISALLLPVLRVTWNIEFIVRDLGIVMGGLFVATCLGLHSVSSRMVLRFVMWIKRNLFS